MARQKKWGGMIVNPAVRKEEVAEQPEKAQASALYRISVDELNRKVDEWRKERTERNKRKTMSSLAAKLGIARTKMIALARAKEHDERDRHAFAIINAWRECEADCEDAIDKSPAGMIFTLCNNFDGWRDMRQVSVDARIGTFDLSTALKDASK